MNLMPKSHKEFSKADYWNTFFEKRGKKAFEWYGEFPELSSYLLKYIKPKDEILIIGCGNSTMGMELYDAGYKNIVNIDVSQVVIKQMQDLNRIKRPDLIFKQMDATNIIYDDNKFSVVLDKGTLDALMPDSEETTVTLINKYLHEIKRVLRNSGRYVCISLLQQHIIKTLAASFSSTFALRIIRCRDAEIKAKEKDESPMPVFMAVATKFLNLPQPVLEIVLTDGPPLRLLNVEEMKINVKSIQESASLCNSLYKSSVANNGEVSFDLYKPGAKDPRYTIFILDQLMTKERISYGAFIVPQGRETDWLFSTREGRQQLLKSAQRDRLAIVILRRGQIFEDLETVKSELADSIKNFAPFGLSKSQIPFLSLGSDIGQRKIVYEGKSDFSGPFVVEEIETESGLYRRLVFLNNQFVIQSEAKLKLVTSRRKKTKYIVDLHYVACDHHLYMSIGLKSAINNKSNGEAIVIGLGGGALCTFINLYIPQATITAVEIDPAILKVATDHFGLVSNEKLKIDIADGVEYLLNVSKQEKKFDAILFDVDSKDPSVGMSCPPKQFVESACLKAVENCLFDDGLFILNLVARNRQLRNETIADLMKIYNFVASYKTEEDINEIIFCSKNEKSFLEWKDLMQNSAKSLNELAKAKNNTDELIELSTLMDNLKIQN